MGRAWLWKGGAGKTLGCRANARNVREATHAPSERQANPSLSHSPHSGILSATLVPSLLPHLLLLLSPLPLLLLLRFFLLFFTLTAH